jgi:hypothetical protein
MHGITAFVQEFIVNPRSDSSFLLLLLSISTQLT